MLPGYISCGREQFDFNYLQLHAHKLIYVSVTTVTLVFVHEKLSYGGEGWYVEVDGKHKGEHEKKNQKG
jgi:hypothetical protein